MFMSENLGQHFLQDESVVRDIGKAAGIETGDVVLEVGPGKGVLTQALLKSGAEVVAVEKDPQLAKKLKEEFKSAVAGGQLKITNEDVRDIDLGRLPQDHKVVANIPYYLTSDLIRRLMTANNQPQLVVMLVQKEVANRIAAEDKNSVLSISVQAYGDPSIVRNVDKEAFSPPPKVQSAVLKITDISRDFFADIDEETFFQLVKTGFAHKRKQLKNNLSSFASRGNITEVLEGCGLEPVVRAERLNLSNWRCVYEHLTQDSRYEIAKQD